MWMIWLENIMMLWKSNNKSIYIAFSESVLIIMQCMNTTPCFLSYPWQGSKLLTHLTVAFFYASNLGTWSVTFPSSPCSKTRTLKIGWLLIYNSIPVVNESQWCIIKFLSLRMLWRWFINYKNEKWYIRATSLRK